MLSGHDIQTWTRVDIFVDRLSVEQGEPQFDMTSQWQDKTCFFEGMPK